MVTASTRESAIQLMREAMSRLSPVNHAQALIHLERAIDTAERPPSLNSEPADGSDEELPGDQSLARAVGGALAVIGTLLNKSGTVPIGEFADALGYYAVVSAEHDSREGIYLGCWAAMLRELADEHPKSGGH